MKKLDECESLWELLELALEHADEIMKTGIRYRPLKWVAVEDGKACGACLAGFVMLGEGLWNNKTGTFARAGLTEREEDLTNAIDEIREGDFDAALETLHGSSDDSADEAFDFYEQQKMDGGKPDIEQFRPLVAKLKELGI